MKKTKKNLFNSILIVLPLGLLFSILTYGKVFETLELKTLDFRFRHFYQKHEPSKDIVIVTIDQNSIDYLKYKQEIYWQWPRTVYADVIRYLKSSGAKAVLMDFDFSDPDITRAGYDEEETDTDLKNAIKEAGNVITSAHLSKNPINKYKKDTSGYRLFESFSLKVNGLENITVPESPTSILPIKPIMEHSLRVGLTNIYPDRDGTVRRLKLFQKFMGNTYPPTALAVAMSILDVKNLTIDEKLNLTIGNKDITISEDGEVYINWYGPGGANANTYKYYPIADVLFSYINTKEGRLPPIAKKEFKDKIVLIGSNAAALYDLKVTPFSGKAAYPGVEIIATVINNLIDGTSLYRINKSWIITLTILSTLLTSYLVLSFDSIIKSILFSSFFILTVFYTAVVFYYYDIFLSIVPVESGILISFIAATSINYIFEGKEKRWVKKAFSHYVPVTVMSDILNNPEKLKLGGEKREVSIFFSDIRNFTTISEKLKPEQVVSLLNEYFTPMSAIILENHGTLDKFIGDAIMAIYGAPLSIKNHEEYACHSALLMLDKLEFLKKKWSMKRMSEDILSLDIGIGINSGNVSVGNMGSNDRFDYTAIGDEVNLTSRLEGLNKHYGTHIIVSESVYQKTKEIFLLQELDIIRVMGKKNHITIYELLKKRTNDEKDEILKKIIEKFEKGLMLYRSKKWYEAISIFNELYKETNKEYCKEFINRCNNLKSKQLPKDWDGIFEMRNK